jgi:peptidyl-prolyl cis-trans isomerase SurA
MKGKHILTLGAIAAIGVAAIGQSQVQSNIVDEVVWVVGDEAIFRSDVEEQYNEMKLEGTNVPANPYCAVPEQIAVEKLYLHQAKLDTIEPNEGQINSSVEKRINYFVSGLGSKERVEEYFHKSVPELREQLKDVMRTQFIIQQVQSNLTKNVKATPQDVKKYFASLSSDSIPYVPLQVEAQIITFYPNVPKQEVEDVKARLRDYAERVNNGEADFSTLAIMYSEDTGSAMQGGELGFHGRADFVPEFSNVAFNLSDPKKVSRIVETEYGYHIIQLIEKRGDQVNARHILLRPHVSSADLEDARVRLDSLRKEIVRGRFTFEEAAQYASHDKDTRNNKGIMVNAATGSSRFEMQQLPAEAAKQIENMNVGDISEAFIMTDPAKNREVVAVVKLTNRIEGHRASLSEDYNMIKEMYEQSARDKLITEWIEKKIKDTYIRIEDGWDNCEFQYNGWKK